MGQGAGIDPSPMKRGNVNDVHSWHPTKARLRHHLRESCEGLQSSTCIRPYVGSLIPPEGISRLNARHSNDDRSPSRSKVTFEPETGCLG